MVGLVRCIREAFRLGWASLSSNGAGAFIVDHPLTFLPLSAHLKWYISNWEQLFLPSDSGAAFEVVFRIS